MDEGDKEKSGKSKDEINEIVLFKILLVLALI